MMFLAYFEYLSILWGAYGSVEDIGCGYWWFSVVFCGFSVVLSGFCRKYQNESYIYEHFVVLGLSTWYLMAKKGLLLVVIGVFTGFWWFFVSFPHFLRFLPTNSNTKPNQTKPELTNESAAWCSLTGNINHSSEFGCIHEDWWEQRVGGLEACKGWVSASQ